MRPTGRLAALHKQRYGQSIRLTQVIERLRRVFAREEQVVRHTKQLRALWNGLRRQQGSAAHRSTGDHEARVHAQTAVSCPSYECVG